MQTLIQLSLTHEESEGQQYIVNESQEAKNNQMKKKTIFPKSK